MRVFAMTLIVGLFVAALQASESDQTTTKELEGTWLAMEAELGGEKLPAQATSSLKLKITGNTYHVMTAEGPDQGTFRTMTDKNPKAMDITGTNGPNQGRTFLTIYEVKGDVLRVCYGLDGKTRPKEFKTNSDPKVFLVMYKRQKP